MSKNCIDPTFFGTAIYAKVGGKVMKLSKLREARQVNGDEVEFDTLNTTYLASFTNDACRKTFWDTCKTIARTA